MGTPAITLFLQDDKPLCATYTHWDGYLEGYGKDLINFLSSKKLVNGIPVDNKNVFNGMGCLAASVIAHFKHGPGGIYMVNVDSREGYNYIVYNKNQSIYLKYSYGSFTYDGPIDENTLTRIGL